MKHFFHQLKCWRLSRGLSQKELARKAGIPRPNLIDLETGRRDCTLKTLQALAKALQVRPGELLDTRPSKQKELNRHELDRLARSFFKKDPKISPRLRFIKKAVAPLISPILASIDKVQPLRNRPDRIKYSKHQAESFLEREELTRFIRRVNKLAERYV